MSLADRDRPLAARGIKALSRIRGHLQRSAHQPEIVLCSSSRRTIDTLAGVRSAIPADAVVVVRDEIYTADPGSLLALFHGFDDDVACALVIGHNPTLQDLALMLVGAGPADLREQLASKLPTGAVVTLSFGDAWVDLAKGAAELDDFYTPRAPRS
jgi:phosphohistidine phosphatase